ncbi:MAG: alpha/beta hydrolase [Oscillospiraceae bacterium]|nr:alpha/beta hydrolase [Oscillospiraceae bacterium]
MKVYEFGIENERTFAMFQCAAEPWWVFEASAKEMARDYHVYLFIADGHDEQGTTFLSIETYVEEAADWLRGKGVSRLDAMYGVSMGGASVIRFLATEDIPVEMAIIDAGITPYPYPRFICRLISYWDWLTVMLATKSMIVMKLAMPPERWTPKDEDPETHYKKIFDFEKHHFSPKTIYNVFWSANNYSMPNPVRSVDTRIEYWYGEEEKRARKNDLAYTRKAYPQTAAREFKGLAHAELLLMFPERFYAEATRVLRED